MYARIDLNNRRNTIDTKEIIEGLHDSENISCFIDCGTHGYLSVRYDPSVHDVERGDGLNRSEQ